MLHILQIGGVILFVLFFFGLCIFIHEFGHMITALWRGLHVERFSVGFGKKLWGFTRNNVEYVVSALPFGGYVALPQLEPTDTPETSTGEKLPAAKPVDKILTALSGPFFNVLFAIFLSLFIWWLGVYRPAPRDSLTVVKVPRESAEYAAGLRAGDQITRVNGESVDSSWQDIAERIALSTGDVTLTVRRDDPQTPTRIIYDPQPNPEAEGLAYPFFRVRTPAEIQKVIPGKPAAKAGLNEGDRILEVNGERVHHPGHFISLIRDSGGGPLDILVRRNGEKTLIKNVMPGVEEAQDKQTYQIGAMIKSPQVLKHLTPWRQFVDVYQRTSGTLQALFTPGSHVQPRHMSGPVGILQMIWFKVTYGGFRAGLSFIILVSYSLAFFNLLPIPVLDGGHILFASVELISRRRVPARFVHIVQNAFAVLLITFMLYITMFDVRRLGKFIGVIDTSDTTRTEEKQPAREKTPDSGPRDETNGAGEESPQSKQQAGEQ